MKRSLLLPVSRMPSSRSLVRCACGKQRDDGEGCNLMQNVAKLFHCAVEDKASLRQWFDGLQVGILEECRFS